MESGRTEERSDARVKARIEVRRDPERQGLGVFVVSGAKPGEPLGFFSGDETATRSRMSLQFGAGLFIEPGEQEPLRNLNHSCDPSARFTGRELRAARDLAAGEALTIDYNLHEEELSNPFPCACGAKDCAGEVRGWRFLTEAAKARRRADAGAWLTAPRT